jgi:hypothetical protein
VNYCDITIQLSLFSCKVFNFIKLLFGIPRQWTVIYIHQLSISFFCHLPRASSFYILSKYEDSYFELVMSFVWKKLGLQVKKICSVFLHHIAELGGLLVVPFCGVWAVLRGEGVITGDACCGGG